MELMITRTRGVNIKRGDGNQSDTADVFWLDKGVEFGLNNEGDGGHCPAGETQVVMGKDRDITSGGVWSINLLDGTQLKAGINNTCTYNVGCSSNYPWWISGYYVTGFDSVNCSNSNNQIELSV